MSDRTRVLCVDDNQDSAVSTAELLELSGFETRAFHDGPAALAAVAEFRPDVCVLDLTMPGMDGLELAGRIREVSGGVRLVALTALWDVTTRHRTRNAGFDDHVVKPVSRDRLLEAVRGTRPASAPAGVGG